MRRAKGPKTQAHSTEEVRGSLDKTPPGETGRSSTVAAESKQALLKTAVETAGGFQLNCGV